MTVESCKTTPEILSKFDWTLFQKKSTRNNCKLFNVPYIKKLGLLI